MINKIQQKSFTLLRNLENNYYKPTKEDLELMEHSSFKKYRGEHVKKLVDGSFFRAVRDLLNNGWLTYENFNEITKPVSNWYRQKFIDSFYYHCTNPKGQFYEQCKDKKLIKSNDHYDNKNKAKICFICE